MNDARGLKPGQSFWGAVLEERGWTAEQAARLLPPLGIIVAIYVKVVNPMQEVD